MIERLELRRDGRRLLTYGTTRGADLVLRGLRRSAAASSSTPTSAPRVRGGERRSAAGRCPILGQHNALNALAAIAAASEAGISDEAIRAALATLHRRQAPLRADRHLERRGDLRRLCPSSGGDRRRAGGGARRRARARHRRVRAAPLFARARSLRRVLRLLPRCRQRHRGAALFGRRAADRRASISTTSPKASARPGIRRSMAIDSLARSRSAPAPHAAARRYGVCLGAGTSTEWAHALPDWLGAEEPRRAGSARVDRATARASRRRRDVDVSRSHRRPPGQAAGPAGPPRRRNARWPTSPGSASAARRRRCSRRPTKPTSPTSSAGIPAICR